MNEMTKKEIDDRVGMLFEACIEIRKTKDRRFFRL